MASENAKLPALHDNAREAYFQSAWLRLDNRDRYILEQRHGRRTLESISDELGITRERVRQIQFGACKNFVSYLRRNWIGWSEWCAALDQNDIALDLDKLGRQFQDSSAALVFLPLVFASLGWAPHGKGSSWWIKDWKSTKERVNGLLFGEPLPQSEWEVYRQEAGVPKSLIEGLMASSELPVEEFRGYIIRSKHRRRDRAHVYLLEHGIVCAREIAEALGEKSSRSLDAFMSRQDIFTKVYPGGEWGLTEFVSVKYRRAIDAMLDMLSNHGPLTKADLNRHMSSAFPVSVARIEQCLTDFRIGKMPDGKIWLVEHGARKEAEAAPEQPAHIHCSRNIVGVRRKIDDDILRGSGLMDSRWLAWRLGLHATPMSRSFAGVDGLPEIRVTRAGSNCQISSLREAVVNRGLFLGHTVIILLNLESSTWDLKY